MSEVVRFSVSIEKPLYGVMNRLVERGGYTNRSEFVRDLLRDRIAREEWSAGAKALGTITLVYDHHKRRLSKRLLDLQHESHKDVLAATHVHLDHDLCAETLLVRGKPQRIEALAAALGREKGVLHCALSISSTGRGLG